MKTTGIMIVGVGGQGSLLASKLLGSLLVDEGFDVKVSEVHGMSQRGGSVVTYVKFGEKSLRIDYDFRSATATTGVTAYTNGGWYKLEGYPTHLGMWVYGDGNGANIRMQIRDGNGAVQYISYSPDVATWEGWQYIEATIPSGLPTPIQIQYPIRVMSVGGKVKTSGTLYFDNLRAVYGFRNDDTLSPSLSNITPENGSVKINLFD